MPNKLTYWQKRFLKIKADNVDDADSYTQDALKRIAPARKEVLRLIDSFAERYAKEDGTIDEAEAKKKLSGLELRKWQNNIDEWKRKARAGGYDRELNLEYYRSRVSRIQTLKAQMSVVMAEYAAKESPKMATRLMSTFKATYYRNIYTRQQQKGLFSANFAKFDDKMLKQVIDKPWLGNTFSKRIWKNYTKTLPDMLTETLSKGIVLGYNTDKLTRLVKGRFVDVSQSNLQRLIHTEMSHISETAIFQSYIEDGVEQYEYMATLEKNTCQVCRHLDGQIFSIKERREGINYPVIHARCRCTTSAYYKEAELLKNRQRASRNPITDKLEMISKTNYTDWLSKVGLSKDEMPIAKPAAPKTDFKAIMDKTNFAAKVGAKNANQFIEHLQNNKNADQQELYSVLGDELTYEKMSYSKNFAVTNHVTLSQSAFDGKAGRNPLTVVYHENGHALDYLLANHATDGAGYYVGLTKYKGRKYAQNRNLFSANPDYALKDTINEEMSAYLNQGIEEVKRPRRNVKNFNEKYEEYINYLHAKDDRIKEVINNLKAEKEKGTNTAAISDMMEATRLFGDYPLGFGHGASYWKSNGSQETEFFAEISESLNTDPKQYELIKSILPKSVEIYHQMIKDGLAIVKKKKGL